jgi:hypothetical protein
MKGKIKLFLVLLMVTSEGMAFLLSFSQTGSNAPNLRVVIIRHAEKPPKGDNLTCQGLNRSLKLPGLLYSRFGIPAYTYIPSVGKGKSTKHSRMFQTIIPMAVKYNLVINSKYDENDSAELAADILEKKGLVLIVWQHSNIPAVARALGVKTDVLKWDDNDYDSIWVITFSNGISSFSTDKEGLNVSPSCPF